jgi:hypothetical protein
MLKMKDFRVEIIKKPLNHPLNVQYTDVELLNKKEFLKLKRRIIKDRKCKYSITVLSGQKEPLLFSEKLNTWMNKIRRFFVTKKTIAQMQAENIKREYFHKKYFWFIVIATAILSVIIGFFLEKFINN